MSVVDERIVKMVFDNADFASKITSTINSLTQLNKATDQVANNSGGGLDRMGKAFEQAEIMSTRAGFHIKDVWLKVASILEYQVAGKIVNVGKQIANAMTFEGISDGFKEYELKMGSVQTIMAGTGESLQTVNKYLEELNTYSDKTIYSFADMTNNIGKFTNAGVKLEDAVAAIKGIANEAAISGANANEASRAMYNFSQALSAGYVKLIDWKSIENANMATLGFKDTLLEVASTVGTVEKQADGMYKVLTKNASGAEMKELVNGTKNFNDSLQQQWMTTEVLTKALKIYATDVLSEGVTPAERAAYEAELKTMGMTDAQIAKFEEMGHKATLAASEVKTFTMLTDTLKEAIGSGWAQTWEILIGDFEEAKRLWTEVSNVLGGFIDNTSKARNDLLKSWDALGGRAVLLNSLKRAFEGLVDILKPVKQAFRDVFPPVTAKNLLDITKGIQRFAASLKPTEDTVNKVRSAARGFFSLLDIGLQIIKSFVNAILPAGKGISSLGGFLLDITAKFGNFLTVVDLVVKKTDIFNKVFTGLADVIKKPFEFLKSNLSFVGSGMTGFVAGFKDAAGSMSSFGDIMKKVFDDIRGGLENVKSRLEGIRPLFEGLASLFKGIGNALGTVFKQIGDSISGVSFGGNGISGLTNLFNALLSGGIMYKIFSSVKTFSSFGDVLEEFSDTLHSFQKKINSENLLNIAKAVGILAASIFAVAMIDSNKLAGATAAIGGMVTIMTGAMAALMKAVNSFSTTDVSKTFSLFGKSIFGTDATKMIEMSVTLKAVSKALIAMGAAVLMMSIGLKIVASAAEGGHLWDSFAVVSLMLAELTGVAIALGKWGGKTEKSAKGLVAMTAALILMAEALKIVSKVVDSGNAWQSLGILSIMLGELAGVVLLIENFTKVNLGSMAPLIALALSLNIVVFALKSVSDALGTEGNHIWESLGVVSLLLAELTGITLLLGNFGGMAIMGGAGAVLAAGAILILVQALKQISDALGGDNPHIWQALGVIGVALVELAVGLTAMAGTIPGAAGLLIASAALIVLGGALKIIGSLSLAEIGKGLLAMAGSLIILAIGLTAMIAALPGAAALVVAAAGLTILAGAMKVFATMKWGEIGKSIAMLAASLAAIAVLGTVLSVASPFILVFSAALLVFGAALVTTGVGMTLFAAGAQAFFAVLPMATAAINALATTLINLIPVLVGALWDALGMIASKIVEYGPVFGECVLTIFTVILDTIAGMSLKFGETVLTLIQGILQVLTDHIPEIAQAGTDLMIAYMQAIATEIPRVVDEAYKCAIALMNGLADAIEANNGELIAAVDHLMDAVIQAITQWLVEFTPLGAFMDDELKEGIMNNDYSVKDAMDTLINNVVESIKGKWQDFKEAAENLLSGFVEGLKGTWAGKAISAAAEFGGKVVDGLNSKKGLDEHSPSLKGEESGENLVQGLINGMESKEGKAADVAALLGDSTVGALADKTEKGSGVIEKFCKKLNISLDDINKVLNGNSEAIEKNGEAWGRWGGTWQIEHPQKVDRWGTTLKAASGELSKNTEELDENTKAQEANTVATDKAGKATGTQADLMQSATGVIQAFTKNYGHLYTQLGETGPVDAAKMAIENLAKKTVEASEKGKSAAEQNKKTAASYADMVKAFTDMYDKIHSSVKSVFEGDNFFQKFEVKTEKTMADMLEAMRSNVNAVADWSNKLVQLGNSGIDQGLLKQLAELGPKGFEYVNAFANATADQIAEANLLFAQAGMLPNSVANDVVSSYAQAGMNVALGLANGFTDNAYAFVNGVSEAGQEGLDTFTNLYQIQSPSKVMYTNGRHIVTGLANGILGNRDTATKAARTMAEDILNAMESMLTYDKFFAYGENIGQGLADGINSKQDVVSAAAEALSEIAAKVTEKLNEIKSPSKLYKRYGKYIAEGLAIGMTEGTEYVENSATLMSEAIRNTLDTVKDISENDMELHPVISPVLDLSAVRSNAATINGLFPGQSIAMASSIRTGSASNDGGGMDVNTNQMVGAQQINFTQNNYSPKALSRYEIYRQTKNQVSQLKGVLA